MIATVGRSQFGVQVQSAISLQKEEGLKVAFQYKIQKFITRIIYKTLDYDDT